LQLANYDDADSLTMSLTLLMTRLLILVQQNSDKFVEMMIAINIEVK